MLHLCDWYLAAEAFLTCLSPDMSLLSLAQEYWMDAYLKAKDDHLQWIRYNQPKLRWEKYKAFKEAAPRGYGESASNFGRPIILPSTFSGGLRHIL